MKILVASAICPRALERLRLRHDLRLAVNGSEAELVDAIADREVLVFRSGVEIGRTVLEAAPDLKLLIRAGSGLDNLDHAYAQSRGMTLVRVPEPGAQAVAELAFAFMLHLAREIGRNDQALRQGHWRKRETRGFVLRGKTLGIIGAGNIGSRVGEMGVAWGMRVLGCLVDATQAELDALAAKKVVVTDFERVVREADFLSIHVPKLPSTLNLVDREVLSWMKPTSFLVNLARGGVVDEVALHEALQNGRGPAGAALDVHLEEGEGRVSPLASLENVVLTPHIGATTVDTMREIGERVIAIIEEHARDREAEAPETGRLRRRTG